MKIARRTGIGGQFQLVPELGDYDGNPPVGSLIIEHAPLSVNPELLGMACYLAFGDWSGGELQLPAKIGPATADAMTRDARRSGVGLLPGPIEYYPKALPLGIREVRLAQELDSKVTDTIFDVRIDKWTGSLRGHSGLVVPSNSFLFARSRGDIRSHLAVALLFAEDLHVDSIVVHQDVDTEEQSRLISLLSAVRVGLRFVSPDDPSGEQVEAVEAAGQGK